MKLMNTVRAGTRGRVREIRARDGNLVEYGEALLLLDPREAA
jgi:biotin carboxyl carrier protein